MDCWCDKNAEKLEPVKNAAYQEKENVHCQSRNLAFSHYQYFMEQLCEWSWQAQNFYRQTRERALAQDTFTQ